MEKETLTIKEKIIKISNELRIEKEGINMFQGYNYFRPDSILIALNPLLEKYKLITRFNMQFSSEKQMYECILLIEETTGENKPVEYKLDIPLTEVKGASKAQGAGATQTYAKRYLLMNCFNIADDNLDPDSKPFQQEKLNTSENNDGVCPECGSNMIIKTGKRKNGSNWQGQQCVKVKCKYHKQFIFLPDKPKKEEIDRALNQDIIDDEANNQQDDLREYGI